MNNLCMSVLTIQDMRSINLALHECKVKEIGWI